MACKNIKLKMYWAGMYREQKSTLYKEENKNKTINKAKKVKPGNKGKE
jgi:hypothetical protein